MKPAGKRPPSDEPGRPNERCERWWEPFAFAAAFGLGLLVLAVIGLWLFTAVFG